MKHYPPRPFLRSNPYPITTILVLFCLTSPPSATAQINFTDVSDASGLGDFPMPEKGFGSGVAAADFDDDGWVDFFVPTISGSAHLLYRNQGDGTFVDVAAARGLTETLSARVGLWIDADGDGRLDLLIADDCYSDASYCEEIESFLRLYLQTGGGNFTEVTETAGLVDATRVIEEHRSGLAAADVDADGDVDFVAAYWVPTQPSVGTVGSMHLYLNQGDGTFVESSDAAGIDDAVVSYHQPVLLDFNSDGLTDLYSSVDFSENRLWIQQSSALRSSGAGVPTFTDVALAAGCASAWNDMGVAPGDFDDDGDIDLYVTNIFRDDRFNVLQRNDTVGDGAVCTEIAESSGVDEGGWGWGATFFDPDNDGRLDLVETNGWRINDWDSPPRLFVRQGDSPITFTDQAAAAGLTQASWGSTIIAFDYDRDGDADLLHTHQYENPRRGALQLFRNDHSGAPALTVLPRADGARPLGARLQAEIDGRTMTRWIAAGTSYLGQEPAEASFGLGPAEVVDRLTIFWPDGRVGEFFGVLPSSAYAVESSTIFNDGFETGAQEAWLRYNSPQ